MLIYFAGPLFSQSERAFNQRLTERLEGIQFAVFLPQRDGLESKPHHNVMTEDERSLATFLLDRDKILEADIFLFVLDGRVPDEGACVELGIAYGQRHLQHRDKFLVGLQTDLRAAFLTSKLNLMISVPLDYVADNEDDLLRALEMYRQSSLPKREVS